MSFGISSLHAWIRSFKCFLHIAYRLEIKCWRVQGSNKISLEKRKKAIQDGLKQELGILVDIPNPGSGSTNDGNTARTFFSNSEAAARVTGTYLFLSKFKID